MQLNRLTDYAVVILGQMTRHRGATVSALDLAKGTGFPLPTVQKVLKQLAKAGLVASQRGVGGGYQMVGTASEVTVGDVVTAMQGPIMLTACVEGSEDPCNCAAHCPLAGNWNRVNEAIRAAFASVTLEEMLTFPAPGPASVPDPVAKAPVGVPA
ncbi:MAG: SUF system Fe-S cluster assembly regulator [Alphaproteobacteria bacterium]|nr:SUF system Fe-S cluster assembly regulator [Alphaproteobacteria bacterium]